MPRVRCLVTAGVFDSERIVTIPVVNREPILAFVQARRVFMANGNDEMKEGIGELEVLSVGAKAGMSLLQLVPPDESPKDGSRFYMPIDDVIWE